MLKTFIFSHTFISNQLPTQIFINYLPPRSIKFRHTFFTFIYFSNSETFSLNFIKSIIYTNLLSIAIEQNDTYFKGLIWGANLHNTSKNKNRMLSSIAIFSRRITSILYSRMKLIMKRPISKSLNYIFLNQTSCSVTLAIVYGDTTDLARDDLNLCETSVMHFWTFTAWGAVRRLLLSKELRAALRIVLLLWENVAKSEISFK